MKTLIVTALLTASLLFSVQAEAATQINEDAVKHTLSTRDIGEIYATINRGKKIETTLLGVVERPNAKLCMSFIQTLTDNKKNGKAGYEPDSVEGVACIYTNTWVVDGSREHRTIQAAMNVPATTGNDDDCQGSDQYRSESKVATAARRQAKNLERGRKFDVVPVLTEGIIGAVFVDRRSTKRCRS